MRFQLTQDWPVGALLVPARTILDQRNWRWTGVALPWPPPVTAMALDQEAYDELLKHHPHHLVQSVPGIERHGDKKGT